MLFFKDFERKGNINPPKEEKGKRGEKEEKEGDIL